MNYQLDLISKIFSLDFLAHDFTIKWPDNQISWSNSMNLKSDRSYQILDLNQLDLIR